MMSRLPLGLDLVISSFDTGENRTRDLEITTWYLGCALGMNGVRVHLPLVVEKNLSLIHISEPTRPY